MSVELCNCCPSPKQCHWDNICWNAKLRRQQEINSAEIHRQQAIYDNKVAQVKEQRASLPEWKPVEKKVIDKPADCGHNAYSAFGICQTCGFWKK